MIQLFKLNIHPAGRHSVRKEYYPKSERKTGQFIKRPLVVYELNANILSIKIIMIFSLYEIVTKLNIFDFDGLELFKKGNTTSSKQMTFQINNSF